MRAISFGFRRQLPVLLQSERSECGVVCLAMIAGYHGRPVELTDLRRLHASSQRGTSAAELMKISATLGFAARTLKLEVDELPQLKLPVILHWNMNHFVVLKAIRRGRYHIHDPATGDAVIAGKKLGECFTGIAIELEPVEDFSPSTKRPMRSLGLSDFMSRFLSLKSTLVQLFIVGLLLEAVALLMPIGSQIIIDDAVVSRDKDLIVMICIGLLGLLLLQLSINTLYTWFGTILTTRIGVHLVSTLFSKLTSVNLEYFEKRSVGDVVNRFGSASVLQNFVSKTLIQGSLDIVLVAGAFGMMCFYHWQLALIGLVACVVYLLAKLFLFRSLIGFSDQQISFSAKRDSIFLEAIRGMQSIKIYGKRSDRIEAWMNANVDEVNSTLNLARLNLAFVQVNKFVFGLDTVAFLFLASREIIAGSFSLGMFFAFGAYKTQFSARMGSLIDKVFEFRSLRLHFRRLGDIVNEPSEEAKDLMPMPAALEPSIELRNVSFRYSRTDPFVFRNLNLTVQPGESLGIIGPSGCGKSTLMKLLVGLLDPSEGEILVGGIPIHQIRDHILGRSLTIVMQGDQLFTGTVLENITFFDRALDIDHAMKCAVVAGLHDDIMAMPMGYQTLLGDMGAALSGGQKQRLLLARAIYPKPRILILDEATSSIDIGTERLINEQLSLLGATKIVISHRKESVMSTNRQIKFAEMLGVNKTIFKPRSTIAGA